MGAHELFEAVRGAHESDPKIAEGRMFGSSGLKVGGKVFAMLVKDRLVVKLPEARVDELIGLGAAIRFDLRPRPADARVGGGGREHHRGLGGARVRGPRVRRVRALGAQSPAHV
jgi:hypothetical protein